MSAELFRTATEGSRIPIASPNGFRRSASMRLRGERPNTLRIRGAGAAPVSTYGLQLHDQRQTVRAPALAAARAPPHNLTVPDQHGTQGRVRSYSLNLSSSRLSGNYDADSQTSPHNKHLDLEDDLDSLKSYASGASTASCEHPFVAHNGTTFSGRRMKYVVHCSAHAGQVGEDYLTPTQRAQRQIRRLKHLLGQAKQDIEQKDSDIFRLTKEVVELRLFKACNNSRAEHSPESSSEAVTVRENADPDATDADLKTPDSPTCTDLTDDLAGRSTAKDMHSSYADSGHFEDLDCTGDRSALIIEKLDKACLARLEFTEERKIIEVYERRLEDAIRAHDDKTHDLKQKHNEKIEELLHKLSDVNIRYCQMVPDYDQAKERIQELEKLLDEVNARLQAYEKGEASSSDQTMALVAHTPSRVSVSELLQQLQMTQTELDNIKDSDFTAEQSLLSAKEAVSLWVLGARKAMYRRLVETRSARHSMDPEITLQFLKSAIYYFLTDRENHHGHLRAIQSILGFTAQEIANIDRARAGYYH